MPAAYAPAAYAFVHRLTQDAAYAALLATNRRALHSAAADALLAQHVPGGPADEAQRRALAQHCAAAGRHREAHDQYCALLSLRDSGGRLAGWDALAALAAEQWDAARALDRALPAESTLLLTCRGFHAQRLGQPDAGRADLERALDLARAAGDAATEADILATLGMAAGMAGRMAEALACQRAALELAQAAGLGPAEVRSRMQLGSALADQGEEAAALEQFRAALSLTQRLGNLRREGILHVSIGVIEAKAGRHARAKASYGRALELLRATGDRLPEAITLGNLGTVELELGNHAAAEALFEAARRMCLDLDERRTRGVWQANLALLAQLRGAAPAEAAAMMTAAHDIAVAGGDIFAVARVLCLHTELALNTGDAARASVLLDEAEQLARSTGIGSSGELARSLARLRHRLTGGG